MGHAPRVIVVDDDATHRESLAALLAAEGIDVTQCERAGDALGLLRQREAFDLVISDIMMPDMNGLEFASHVRKLRNSMPIVLVTGHDEAVDGVVAAGNIALLKPYSAATLKRVLADNLGRG